MLGCKWDFENKETPGCTGKSSFVLKVPLRYLCPSIIYVYYVTGSCKEPIALSIDPDFRKIYKTSVAVIWTKNQWWSEILSSTKDGEGFTFPALFTFCWELLGV